MFYSNSHPKAPEYEKFYSRVRQNLSALVADPDSHGHNYTECNVPVDKLYGNICKEEFQHILNAYDSQQHGSDKDKPVICSKVNGGSYSRLLVSKQGFHHQLSTAYLIEDLGIRDASRNSFLGGHSTYTVEAGEDYSGISDSRIELKILRIVEKGHKLLDDSLESEALSLIDRLLEISPQHPHIDAFRARYCLATRKWSDAIRLYERAFSDLSLRSERNYIALSEAYFNEGYRYYQRNENQRAVDLFELSLKYNPGHTNSLLHKNMSLDRISRQNSFSNKGPAYRK